MKGINEKEEGRRHAKDWLWNVMLLCLKKDFPTF